MSEIAQILFWSALSAGAVLEFVLPFRRLEAGIGQRWIANFALGGMAMLLSRWLAPLFAALMISQSGFGLLALLPPAWPAHSWISSFWITGALGFLALDLLNYILHRLSHRLPFLWRLHRVHHSDLDVDVSTTFRHHPLEIIASFAVIVTGVIVLAIPPEAVLLHQACRSVMDVASHMNVRLPERLDHLLRLVIITPGMHRIHHSSRQPETDSNYSTLLSLWDHLGRSYCATPAHGQQGMTLGLAEWRDERALSLPQLLWQPLTPPAASHPARTSLPDNR